MKAKKQTKNSVHNVYVQAVYLCLAAHIIIAFTFAVLRIYPMLFYNLFSIFFYAVIKATLSPARYRLIVALVHIEVAFFASFTTVFVGWAAGYSFYLIALCSLVYICPYKNMYVPYFFSLGELLIFIALKLFCDSHRPLHLLPAGAATDFVYLFNAAACFGVIIYAALISNLSSVFMKRELMEQNQNLQTLLHHDSLTHLYTRNYLQQKFDEARQASGSIALAMVDVDDFKKVNDTYGHSCGDYVLFTLATIMQTVSPSRTDIARWGGEEFVLLLYGQTREEALEQIQNLRRAIASYHFHYSDYDFRITATFGLCFSDENADFTALVNLADERMYCGKKNGKNTVVAG